MTDFEKASELARKYIELIFTPQKYTVDDCLLEMSKWKEEQMIEKACEWLKDNVNDYLDWYDWEQCRVDKDELLYDFRKAMKGGKE